MAFWSIYHQQRRRLLALEHDLALHIHALWQSVPQQMRPLFQRIITEYEAELARIREEQDDPHARVSPAWISQQVHSLSQRVNAAAAGFALNALHQTTHAQGQAAQYGMDDATILIKASIEPIIRRYGVNPVRYGSPGAILAMQGRLANGQPLSDLFDAFGADAAQAAREALVAGMASGSNPRVVARMLDTALGISRNRALTIARTEMLGSYRRAASASYRANSDVVNGWYWQCADDGRTCAACAAMQGTFHSLDEQLDSHVNCRCAMVPKTRSYASILSDYGIDGSDIPDTSITMESGEDWLARQDAKTQRAIIGTNAGYRAYKRGDVSLHDFVGVAHDRTWGTSRYQKSLRQLGIKA